MVSFLSWVIPVYSFASNLWDVQGSPVSLSGHASQKWTSFYILPFAAVRWLVCCFILQIIWADVQKKIKHSHIEYGHVHNALSLHYKDGQMVANVQESTSTNINLDVIECTKQSADTPAWVYNACTCVGCVVHSIESAPQLVCRPSVSGSCSGFLTGPTEVVDECYQNPLQCF